jgi:hypothetical protein
MVNGQYFACRRLSRGKNGVVMDMLMGANEG